MMNTMIRKEMVQRPRVAYTAVVQADGFWVGVAQENIPGYAPAEHFGVFQTYSEARNKADDLNKQLGLTAKDAFDIVISTMRERRRG